MLSVVVPILRVLSGTCENMLKNSRRSVQRADVTFANVLRVESEIFGVHFDES